VIRWKSFAQTARNLSKAVFVVFRALMQSCDPVVGRQSSEVSEKPYKEYTNS
jgi:hypothetical protein